MPPGRGGTDPISDFDHLGAVMANTASKFKLFPKNWYAWEMIPGYFGERNVPYHSPIYVQKVMPLKTGKNIIRLEFINVFYAEGVQLFDAKLRILLHCEHYFVSEILYKTPDIERCAIVSTIEFEWIRQFCPSLWYHRPPSSVSKHAELDVSTYLSEVFLPRQA